MKNAASTRKVHAVSNGIGIMPESGCEAAILMGGSAGGLKVFTEILSALPADLGLPLLIVQHLHHDDNGGFAELLASLSKIPVIEPCDKELILRGRAYIAPAGYHMLVEHGACIALSTSEKVNWSRPSIDVLFESAAKIWGRRLAAVIISGASSDGAAGIKAVKRGGGLTIAQDPVEAEHPVMPQAAIDTGSVDEVLNVADIIRRLCAINIEAENYGGKAKRSKVNP